MRLPRQTEGIETIINLASGWRQRGRFVLVLHPTEVVVAINTSGPDVGDGGCRAIGKPGHENLRVLWLEPVPGHADKRLHNTPNEAVQDNP